MGENKVYYWSERIEIDNRNLSLFTAVNEKGLVMSSIGEIGRDNSNDHEVQNVEHLTSLVKRYLTSHEVEVEKSPNTAVIEQLYQYFQRKLQVFTIPLNPLGTEFQRKVWKALCDIPYGETRSYADIAGIVGCELGQRAVGMANNKNPLGIVVPCHRVIGKNGSLTGYAGGLQIKKMLLELEGQRKSG